MATSVTLQGTDVKFIGNLDGKIVYVTEAGVDYYDLETGASLGYASLNNVIVGAVCRYGILLTTSSAVYILSKANVVSGDCSAYLEVLYDNTTTPAVSSISYLAASGNRVVIATSTALIVVPDASMPVSYSVAATGITWCGLRGSVLAMVKSSIPYVTEYNSLGLVIENFARSGTPVDPLAYDVTLVSKPQYVLDRFDRLNCAAWRNDYVVMGSETSDDGFVVMRRVHDGLVPVAHVKPYLGTPRACWLTDDMFITYDSYVHVFKITNGVVYSAAPSLYSSMYKRRGMVWPGGNSVTLLGSTGGAYITGFLSGSPVLYAIPSTCCASQTLCDITSDGEYIIASNEINGSSTHQTWLSRFSGTTYSRIQILETTTYIASPNNLSVYSVKLVDDKYVNIYYSNGTTHVLQLVDDDANPGQKKLEYLGTNSGYPGGRYFSADEIVCQPNGQYTCVGAGGAAAVYDVSASNVWTKAYDLIRYANDSGHQPGVIGMSEDGTYIVIPHLRYDAGPGVLSLNVLKQDTTYDTYSIVDMAIGEELFVATTGGISVFGNDNLTKVLFTSVDCSDITSIDVTEDATRTAGVLAIGTDDGNSGSFTLYEVGQL